MTWTWDQSEGRLSRDGRTVSMGYSGRGRGVNNPALEAVRATGPIPAGEWRIGAPYNSANVGPYTLPVYAVDAIPADDIHQPTGRSAFRIHGDSIRNPGDASRGCIIIPRRAREAIWRSGDRVLIVVA
jgi:hypothetical protein